MIFLRKVINTEIYNKLYQEPFKIFRFSKDSLGFQNQSEAFSEKVSIHYTILPPVYVKLDKMTSGFDCETVSLN